MPWYAFGTRGRKLHNAADGRAIHSQQHACTTLVSRRRTGRQSHNIHDRRGWTMANTAAIYRWELRGSHLFLTAKPTAETMNKRGRCRTTTDGEGVCIRLWRPTMDDR